MLIPIIFVRFETLLTDIHFNKEDTEHTFSF